jgi:hypothetical protein
MEPEGSIPNSQELSTCSYPLEDDFKRLNSIFIIFVRLNIWKENCTNILLPERLE